MSNRTQTIFDGIPTDHERPLDIHVDTSVFVYTTTPIVVDSISAKNVWLKLGQSVEVTVFFESVEQVARLRLALDEVERRFGE